MADLPRPPGGRGRAGWNRLEGMATSPQYSPTAAFEGYKIVEFDRLLVMKLTAFRLKDRVHLLDMIDVGLIDATTLDPLSMELRPRLEQLLTNPNG